MENKNKYLVITPLFPTQDNYVGSYIYDQVKQIENHTNLDIIIIKVVPIFSTEIDYEYNGLKILIFKIIDFPFFIFPSFFHFFNKTRIYVFTKRKGISDVSFVHAHVTYPSAYLASDLSNKLNAVSFIQHHGLDVFHNLNGRFKILRLIWRRHFIKKSVAMINTFDINIGVSKKVLNEFNNYDLYNPNEEIILYNGVDKSKFHYKPLEGKNKSFTIGCVANFLETKDHITLIKAVQLLNKDNIDCKLRLIGSGPTYSKCYDYVIQNNLDKIISFEAERKHSDLNIFFNEIDLFVMPSYYEALGCVYLEAWATNTPFIAVEGQGIQELIPEDRKNVFLVKKKNPYLLKDKIQYILDNNIDFVFDPKYYIENSITPLIRQIKKTINV